MDRWAQDLLLTEHDSDQPQPAYLSNPEFQTELRSFPSTLASAGWLAQRQAVHESAPEGAAYPQDFKAIRGDFFSSILCENLIPHLNPKLQKFIPNATHTAEKPRPRISRIFKRPDGATVNVLVIPKPLPPPPVVDWPTAVETSESETDDLVSEDAEMTTESEIDVSSSNFHPTAASTTLQAQQAPMEIDPPSSAAQPWSTITSRVSASDSALLNSLFSKNRMFLVCDPKLPDCPIVHASPNFCEFTGYNENEIIGRNCRFLQGPETLSESVDRIRHCLKTNDPVAVCILNYKKDGTRFWNHFFMCAMLDETTRQANYFVGIQTELKSVTDEHLLNPEQYLQRYRLVSRVEI
eukprot:c11329_g1_i1.p1 GENE.c11329_g1_i1~~c11329_g1_i1.p1  ORF type:complete len:352 (-),score=51.16 c11329_g1_i1:113-1168(-)